MSCIYMDRQHRTCLYADRQHKTCIYADHQHRTCCVYILSTHYITKLYIVQLQFQNVVLTQTHLGVQLKISAAKQFLLGHRCKMYSTWIILPTMHHFYPQCLPQKQNQPVIIAWYTVYEAFRINKIRAAMLVFLKKTICTLPINTLIYTALSRVSLQRCAVA